jgi:hypothetical protein
LRCYLHRGIVHVTMRVAIDARYIREKPSGIGAYVRAIVDRVPREAPADHLRSWTHPLTPRPLSHAPNTEDVIIGPGPNSPLMLLRPTRYARFDDVDVLHAPHNILPRGLSCPRVVTMQDVMEIDRQDLHLQGVARTPPRGCTSSRVARASPIARRRGPRSRPRVLVAPVRARDAGGLPAGIRLKWLAWIAPPTASPKR